MRRAPARFAGAFAVAALVVGAAGCGTAHRARSDAPDGGARVEVIVGMTRHQAALEQAAAAVAAGNRSPLTLAQVAQRYGASVDERAKLAATLRAGGGRVHVDETGALARVDLAERDATRLFGATWQRHDEDGATVLEPTEDLEIPKSLRGLVTEVIGVPKVVGAPRPAPAEPTRLATAAECAEAGDDVDALRASSGLDGLTDPGSTGSGARIALVADQRVDRAAFAVWLRCIGHEPVDLVEVKTPGTSRSAGTDDEIQLDLSALTAALPTVERIEVVRTDSHDWVGDPLVAALTAGSEPPQVISTSVTYCELDLSADEVRLAEHVLAAATAVGTVVVAASGDHGSTACAPDSTKPAVAYPASSPFAVAVGGTDGSGAVWFDPSAAAAGGGGRSSRFPGRTVPDIAGLAAPGDVPPIPVCATRCEWRFIGGTSFAAPFVAGGLARVEQARTAAGAGPLDLGLGRVEGRSTLDAVTDVVDGSNDLDRVGCCAAGPGFDRASGWGVLRFDRLAAG